MDVECPYSLSRLDQGQSRIWWYSVGAPLYMFDRSLSLGVGLIVCGDLNIGPVGRRLATSDKGERVVFRKDQVE